MSREALTRAELAKRTGDSPKSISRFIVEGCPTIGDGASLRFPWIEFRSWRDKRIARMERERVERANAPSLSASRERKMAAEAELSQLQLAREKDQVIPLELHARRLRERLETVAGALKGLHRYQPDIKAAVTDVAADTLIDRMIDETLKELFDLSETID